MAKGHGREGCGSIFHEPWRADCSPKFLTTTEVLPLGNGDEVCHGHSLGRYSLGCLTPGLRKQP